MEEHKCLECGGQMLFKVCGLCGGIGLVIYDGEENAPVPVDEDDIGVCVECKGKGGAWYCPRKHMPDCVNQF